MLDEFSNTGHFDITRGVPIPEAGGNDLEPTIGSEGGFEGGRDLARAIDPLTVGPLPIATREDLEPASELVGAGEPLESALGQPNAVEVDPGHLTGSDPHGGEIGQGQGAGGVVPRDSNGDRV